MNITFLRHATTDLNGKGLIATRMDYSLNDNGKSMCKQNVFDKCDFDNVYCSPFKRTVETAKLVYPYQEPIITPYLAQRNLGELNEKYKKDYEIEYLKLVRNYLLNPVGAESFEDVVYRINSFFEYLINNQKSNDNILVVTHNGIMRIIKKQYLLEDVNIDSNNLSKFSLVLKSKTL